MRTGPCRRNRYCLRYHSTLRHSNQSVCHHGLRPHEQLLCGIHQSGLEHACRTCRYIAPQNCCTSRCCNCTLGAACSYACMHLDPISYTTACGYIAVYLCHPASTCGQKQACLVGEPCLTVGILASHATKAHQRHGISQGTMTLKCSAWHHPDLRAQAPRLWCIIPTTVAIHSSMHAPPMSAAVPSQAHAHAYNCLA